MEPRNQSRVRLGIEELKCRATPAVLTFMVAVVAAFAVLTAPARVSAQGPTAPVWSVVLQTAPGLPQDIWVTGQGTTRTAGTAAGACAWARWRRGRG